jgi:hypothetical protein
MRMEHLGYSLLIFDSPDSDWDWCAWKGKLRLKTVYDGMVYKMILRRNPQNERDLVIGWMKVVERQALNVPSRVNFEISLVLRSFPQTAPIVGGIFSDNIGKAS